MRKFLILFSLVVIASAIMANDARESALGYGAKYFIDDNNVVYCPAMALRYPGYVKLELGTYAGSGFTPTGQWGMANVAIGDNFAIGGALRRSEGDAFWLAGEIGMTPPNPGLDIWGAYKIGSLNLGVGAYLASDSYKEVDDNNNTEIFNKSGVMDFKVSAETELLGGYWQIPIWITMNSVKTEDTNADNETQTDEITGGMEIGACLRGYMPIADNVELVPRLHFTTFSYSREYTPYTGDATEYGDYSRMTLNAGCACNVGVLDDGLVSVGAAIGMANVTDEVDTTNKTEDKTMHLPEITIAAEIPATDWLVVRGGVTKLFITDTHIAGDVEQTTKDPEMASAFASLGFGVNFSGFALDFTMSEDKLFEGPYMLSGVENVWAFRGSMSFNWQE